MIRTTTLPTGGDGSYHINGTSLVIKLIGVRSMAQQAQDY